MLCVPNRDEVARDVSVYNFIFKLLCCGRRRTLKQAMDRTRDNYGFLWSKGCCSSAEECVVAESEPEVVGS